MKLGGLSEEEVAKIGDILSAEGISFSVEKDEELEEFNKTSMENNLRHLGVPNITIHILSIEINDDDFQRLSETAKSALQNYGITDQPPAPEDFVPFSGETIHKELNRSQNKIVAMNFKHQLIIGAIILLMIFVGKMLVDLF